ncbi:unnamed protein product [Staurois parvus]|uniref:Uncharacterized protein n=1 Tax=Staurois parvus TaxID=386267 RepID=A0ABN9BWN2_9NEOB|nr:unnamed protein product [Staurois parvus]
MGPPTNPGPSGSAQVSKWSVRPWSYTTTSTTSSLSSPLDMLLPAVRPCLPLTQGYFFHPQK